MTYHLNHVVELIALPRESLDATLLMVCVINDGIFMFKYGDGSIVFRNHTTNQMIRHYTEYPYNAPYYYNYTRERSDEQKYISMFGDMNVVVDGNEMPVKDYVANDSLHWKMFPISELSPGVWTITLMSDGVETFYNGNDKLDFSDVLNELTSFKNFRGEYVQRKIKKYINGLAKNNIKHYDDISVASITFEVRNNDSV
jgi:hypothetical protein